MTSGDPQQPLEVARQALNDVLVVDLATERAELAGRILADLGARVVKVENPHEGAPSRHVPPFDEVRCDGTSLYWEYLAMGKESVSLDIDQADDLAHLQALLERTDIFIESFDPGSLIRYGLDYAALSERNPTLVYVSVTPFGQTGPDASAPATELTIEASSGLLSLQGDGDRPPIPMGYPQAAFHAGAQAAADALIALHERNRSGCGQHLDVSMQAAMVGTLLYAPAIAALTDSDPHPASPRRRDPQVTELMGVTLPQQLPCADGYVVVSFGLGRLGFESLHRMVQWMDEEGALDARWTGVDLRRWATCVRDGRLEVQTVQGIIEHVAGFIARKSMRQLMDRACQEPLLIAPTFSVADLLEDAHLAERGFWSEVDGRRCPGPFAVLSATPIQIRPAPRAVGEHQAALLDHLARSRRPPKDGGSRSPAFEGLRVVDFSWAAAGPIIGKALGDHGATVVRVESETRVDVARYLPPFRDGVPGLNRSQAMAMFNTSKMGAGINLSLPEGRELGHKLLCWADVAIENFSPGVMAQLGLDYETVVARNPGLVMLSTSMRGATGPERTYRGFGVQGAALSGVHSITGWPDRPPTGPWGAYTDLTTPRVALAAVVAALHHRDRAGVGQHIDISQVEATLSFIGPLILDYVVNSRIAGPRGLGSDRAWPHGVYAAAGDERYVAVAAETHAQLAALRRAVPALSAETDDALAEWMRSQDPWAATETLRTHGVPASVVSRPSDLFTDRQLAHRAFFTILDHPEMGPTPYEGFATIFSATPPELRSPAPCLGQHTDEVLRVILGLSDDEVTRYALSGALE